MSGEILMVVALVTQIKGCQPIGTGTGFFYVKGDALYFVTNRHIVLDEKKKIEPDSLRLKLHVDAKDLTKNQDLDIKLYSKGKPLWHVHEDYKKEGIDIAVLKLDRDTIQKTYLTKALSADVFLPKKYLLPPGQDLFVLGYPRGVSDTKHNLPLARNAMVSSTHGVPFRGQPYFLIDAVLHPGMSWSPVFTKPSSTWVDDKGNVDFKMGNPTYFLGIHSATLNVTLSSAQEPLGLGTVWYADLIDEIIDSIK